MKIKIKKTIKSKIKSKSTTHSAGSFLNQCSLEGIMFGLSLDLNRTPNLLPNLDLHPILNLSPGVPRPSIEDSSTLAAPFRSPDTSFR
jgi:hypothetical protein